MRKKPVKHGTSIRYIRYVNGRPFLPGRRCRYGRVYFFHRWGEIRQCKVCRRKYFMEDTGIRKSQNRKKYCWKCFVVIHLLVHLKSKVGTKKFSRLLREV